MSMKNSSDTIGNRTRDIVASSVVPQATAPPRAPFKILIYLKIIKVVLKNGVQLVSDDLVEGTGELEH
jgi:hypothetical protein